MLNTINTANAAPVITAQMTHESFLPEGPSFPIVIEPVNSLGHPKDWIAQNEEKVAAYLRQYGAILLRGFDMKDEQAFRESANEFIPTLAKYMEGATPRTNLGKGAYTSTEFPSELSIAQHNELSYIKSWPMRIVFGCLIAAEEQGATPIADVRKVLDYIDEDIKQEFAEKGWMLVRNYGNGLGPTWQKAFNTDDIEDVIEYCKAADVELEVINAQQIRTRQVRPAIHSHALTGESVWFNHAAFWHPSSLCPIIRKELVSQFGEDALTYNTLYGDGTVIPDDVIEHINAAYEKATVTFLWQEGDILLMDNMLISHGRSPYKGDRRILVSMGEPVTNITAPIEE
ncbi:TauD/TfdA family dioxygenase [Pseudoalteromonas rubra]|uniref:TauD/TfdA family dioxygenase n=1 Tax=Pseudoalteromonas rubra TaxID=43658 RepID=UPI000F7B4F10|nr:TauD/TfdA family dioxygenase [Pseudoalteromonas rubra]